VGGTLVTAWTPPNGDLYKAHIMPLLPFTFMAALWDQVYTLRTLHTPFTPSYTLHTLHTPFMHPPSLNSTTTTHHTDHTPPHATTPY
jgi:hypothetical protein